MQTSIPTIGTNARKELIPVEFTEVEFMHVINLLDWHIVRNSSYATKEGVPLTKDFYINRKMNGQDLENYHVTPNKNAIATLPLLGRLINQFEEHCKDIDGNQEGLVGTKSIVAGGKSDD